jgi:hypothetical protein
MPENRTFARNEIVMLQATHRFDTPGVYQVKQQESPRFRNGGSLLLLHLVEGASPSVREDVTYYDQSSRKPVTFSHGMNA